MVAAQGGAMKVSTMTDMGQPDDEGEGSYPNDGGAANLDVRSPRPVAKYLISLVEAFCDSS